MRSIRNIFIVFFSLSLSSCANKGKEEVVKAKVKAMTNELTSPAGENSSLPYLFSSNNGTTYMSWVEHRPDTSTVLLFSKLEGDSWSAPKLIAAGKDWFVNWADFPAFSAESDSSFLSHFLAKTSAGTYSYGINFTLSANAGSSWSTPKLLHNDNTNTEHGFVSMLPNPEGGFFTTWLDGRQMAKDEKGAMSIRAAFIDKDGNSTNESVLDVRTCDCCQTGAAWTDSGPVVVYRDRSEDEVRDIYIVRHVNGKWSAPKSVSNDQWEIAGCPVNGPKAAALGNSLAVAWYTKASGIRKVQVAFSQDGGATFQNPIRVDDGNPIGRVHLVMVDKQSAWVSWVEEKGENAEIRVKKIMQDGTITDRFVVSSTASARASGFPQMAYNGGKLIFAWTQADNISRIKTSMFDR